MASIRTLVLQAVYKARTGATVNMIIDAITRDYPAAPDASIKTTISKMQKEGDLIGNKGECQCCKAVSMYYSSTEQGLTALSEISNTQVRLADFLKDRLSTQTEIET